MSNNSWKPVSYDDLLDENLIYLSQRYGIKFAQANESNPDENHIWVRHEDLNICDSSLHLSSFVANTNTNKAKTYWDLNLNRVKTKLGKYRFLFFPK